MGKWPVYSLVPRLFQRETGNEARAREWPGNKAREWPGNEAREWPGNEAREWPGNEAREWPRRLGNGLGGLYRSCLVRCKTNQCS